MSRLGRRCSVLGAGRQGRAEERGHRGDTGGQRGTPSRAAPQHPGPRRCRGGHGAGARPSVGPCPAAGGGREGRGALAERSCAPCLASWDRGQRPALRGGGSIPVPSCPARIPPKTPRKHPQRGPSSPQPGFPPSRVPMPSPPCPGERSPLPLPPLTLFGWTERCLRESFSTLFHIHNGLNIGEQSGTWRAKPSPWSEPMTSRQR